MKFCTVINCIDGRVQLPVIKYLQKKFNADYVDSITEAGPNLILAQARGITSVESIIKRLNISIEKHSSIGIAVVGHYDCAANPALEGEQIAQIQESIRFLRKHYQNIEIIGLWVDSAWEVQEVEVKLQP